MDTRVLMRFPEAVLIQTGNHIVFANQEAQRLFGVDEAALLSQCAASLRAGDGEPRVNVSIVRGDGTVRYVELVGIACRLAVHDHLTVDTPPAPQIATCLYRVAQD